MVASENSVTLGLIDQTQVSPFVTFNGHVVASHSPLLLSTPGMGTRSKIGTIYHAHCKCFFRQIPHLPIDCSHKVSIDERVSIHEEPLL